MKTVRNLALVLAPLALCAWGCGNGNDGGDPEPELSPATGQAAATETEESPSEPAVEVRIAELTVEQTAGLLEAGDCVAVDANGDNTRERYGVIPNARLLTSSSRYDIESELPDDRATKLVFYCGNDACSASDSAAERALTAGYTDVNVLRAGISGWVEAGQNVEQPSS
ncbi:MAG: rhodanese-like domain-containing protein [Myxococcota bacterium]